MTSNSLLGPDFKFIFETSPRLHMVMLPDNDFTVVGASNAFLSTLGLVREKVIGQALIKIFNERPAPRDDDFLAQLKTSVERVHSTKKADAMPNQKIFVPSKPMEVFEERYWSCSNVPLLDQNGKLKYISFRLVDITDFARKNTSIEFNAGLSDRYEAELFLQSQQLREANDELRQSEESLRMLFENSLDAVVGMNDRGIITQWNSQAEKTFGWTKEEALGKIMSTLIIPNEYRRRHENGLENFLKTGVGPILNKRLELKALTKAGSEIPVELSVTSVRNRGNFLFYGVLRDISDRLRSIETLKLAKEAAESANYSKSAFLANMSHELRTPLGAVLGFAELLTERKIDKEEKSRLVKSIRRNGELLSNIINDILDLSKVEADKLTIENRPTLIPDIIIDLESFLAVKAADKGIHFKVHCEDDVPRSIHTDPLRLRQVLLNIVGNAVKFTSRGSVNINISLAPPLLKFTVTDTGIGIHPEESKGLFQAFTQADPSMKRRYGGVGLGLVISKRLAQLLGGDVQLIKSEKDFGSTFEITISPGRIAPVVANGKYIPPKIKTPSHKDVVRPESINENLLLKGLKILLVEDSVDNQILITHLLKLSGAKVETADNGKVAIEKLKDTSYNAILMDLQMPVMDGFEATRFLREQGFSTPIIALTAHASAKDREHCLENGFDDHIPKPIHRNTLVNGIAEICGVLPRPN